MKIHFNSLLAVFLSCMVISISTSSAQNKGEGKITGVPWRGTSGITESVADILARQSAAPPMQPGPLRPRKEEFEPLRKTQDNPLAPAVSQWPPTGGKQITDQMLQTMLPQTAGVNFLGVQSSESGYVPPDCMGDVGPAQILVHVNGRVKVFDKNGVLGSLNVTDNTFWQSVRNGADVSDPHIRYDRISGRWFLVIINIPASGPNRVLIAVSSGSTITSTSSFTFFQFQHDLVGTTPNTDTGGFADYPTLGVDANALYIGANIFNLSTNAYLGSSAYVVRKSDLLTGTLTVTPFRQLTDGSTPGPYTPQGVQNDDPSSTEGYIIGVDAVSYSTLVIRRVTNPGGTPVLSSNINMTVPTTTSPILQVVKGSTSSRRLDAIDDRLFAAHIKKNKITGAVSLWTAHNIQVNASGVGSNSGGRNGSRWYEITNFTTSTPVLRQSGTLYSSASTNPIGYWIPTVAMSGQGYMALGCSYASVNDYAGVAIAGRLYGDSLGITQSPTSAVTSSSAYNVESVDGQRWGDYSQVAVDPNDDMTMWTFQEYCNATNSWGLRVIQLLAPPPAIPVGASPASVAAGTSNIDVVLTGASSSGSGFFDPGTGYVNRISASVNGGGVTVNGITFTNSTTITLNLSVASNASTGARTVAVTNPDGQHATSLTGIFTINNSGCTAITLSPTVLPGGALGTPYSQDISASGGITPYTYSLSSGSLPGGISLSATGILAGTPTTGGNYSFTITATDSNGCTGNQAYSLAISGCPTITLSPLTLPSGTVSIAYNQTITASGGTSPYTYSITSESLPAGLILSSAGVLSGTTSTSGTFPITVTATDSSLCNGSQAYALTINPSGASTVSLTIIGSPYSQDFNTLASNGTSSTMPAGWTFLETGTNANTTYSAGNGSSNTGDTYSFGATSSSERAFGGLQSNSLIPSLGANFTNNTGSTITGLAISYFGEQWRLGTRNRFDSLRFQYSLNASSLSTGTWTPYSALDFRTPDTSGAAGARDGNVLRTNLNSTISGLNIVAGSTFWIRWTDVNATGADDGLAVDDFSITPVGAAPPTNPVVTGAASPLTVAAGDSVLLTAAVTPGTNPASSGLTVNANLITIGGSASQTFYDDGTHGDSNSGDNTFSFKAKVTLSTAPGAKNLPVAVTDAQSRTGGATIALNVTAPPCQVLNMTTFPGGTVGVLYSHTVVASGGVAPYSFADSGNLPIGLTFDTTGRLHGTPAGIGSFIFSVKATDINGCTGSSLDTVTIVCPAITLSSLPAGIEGTDYNHTITASGGQHPYVFEITAGQLPPGCSLSSNGDISGTPSAHGNFNFSITATDSLGCPGTAAYSIVINCPALSFSSLWLPQGTVGVPYNYTYAAAGGKPPYTFEVTAGLLPSGLSLAPAGHLSGTPGIEGSTVFTITAADSEGCTASRNDTLRASCPPIVIAPSSLPGDTIGKTYNQILEASGGKPPYTFGHSGGTLPNGLSIFPSGVITGIAIDTGDFSFNVAATDSNGCIGTHSYAMRVSDISVYVPVAIQGSWNLLANSVAAANDTISVLFPGASSKAFVYKAGAYFDEDLIESGAGFWLKFPAAESLRIFGLPIKAETVAVNQGWNLIGSISDPIAVSSITSEPSDVVATNFFGYSGLYTPTDTLYPSKGYWVKVNKSGSIMLSSHSSLSAAARIKIVPTAEMPPIPPVVDNEDKEIPEDYALAQAFPNPFNPSTTIKYQLPVDSRVRLKVINVLGQVVTVLVDQIKPAGNQTVEWNAIDAPTGVYFYKLEAMSMSDPGRAFRQVRKMLLVR